MYFFVQHSPLQFQVCAIFQLSIDFGQFIHHFKYFVLTHATAIIVQRLYYGTAMPVVVVEEDDLEQALVLADAEE